MEGIKQFLTGYDMWSNELYIMGESYAVKKKKKQLTFNNLKLIILKGVYVPYLSYAINTDNAIKKANN